MALGGAAWRNETRAWRHAMLKTPRPNTEMVKKNLTLEPVLDGMNDVSICVKPQVTNA